MLKDKNMKENMTQRIKAFIVLLAATVATAGTAWGQSNETLSMMRLPSPMARAQPSPLPPPMKKR